jgi:hypothetical protein
MTTPRIGSETMDSHGKNDWAQLNKNLRNIFEYNKCRKNIEKTIGCNSIKIQYFLIQQMPKKSRVLVNT